MTFTRKRKVTVWLKDEIVTEDDDAIMWVLDHNDSVHHYQKEDEK